MITHQARRPTTHQPMKSRMPILLAALTLGAWALLALVDLGMRRSPAAVGRPLTGPTRPRDGQRLEQSAARASRKQLPLPTVATGSSPTPDPELSPELQIADTKWGSFKDDAGVTTCGFTGPEGKEGLWRTFGPEGSLLVEQEFRSGMPWGMKRRYGLTGMLYAESQWERGSISGYSRTWHGSGRLASEQHFDAGVPDGEWTAWLTDGSIHSHGFYQDGRRHGHWEFYRGPGDLDAARSGRYINGKRED